jgi:hypothetical protein
MRHDFSCLRTGDSRDAASELLQFLLARFGGDCCTAQTFSQRPLLSIVALAGDGGL